MKTFENKKSCVDCQLKSSLFKLLSDSELEIIDKNRTTVNFNKGETIRKQGAVLTHVISLSSGMAKVYLEGEASKNVILGLVNHTSIIGGPGMFIDHINHFTVTSLTNSCVCFIKLETFKEMLQKNSQFADGYFQHLSNITLSAYNRLINLSQKQMAGRLADTLIYLSKEIFISKKFELILSKNDLAELSGMSKDNVVRILKRFQEEGLINISNDIVEILDYDRLTNIY